MTAFNCKTERAYEDGSFKGEYRALKMEREAKWDRDNKVGQIYPAPGADARWLTETLNEVLKDVTAETYLYLYRDFVIEWDIAILLLNGSALIIFEYDREKVLAYLERNMGEIAKIKREDWRLISISQPRVIKRKLKVGETYFDEEGKKHVCEEAGQYKAKTGNALTTLHVRRELAEMIKKKGGVIPFQHGPVKVKWGDPEIVFSKDLYPSSNETPLGPNPKPKAAPKERKFVEKPEYRDPNKIHLSWADRNEDEEEQYEEIVDEYTNFELEWEQHGKNELTDMIDKFKYLLENPTDDDDISVKSYRTDAGSVKGSTAGLTKGQKKNLAIKKKTLCDKARKIRQKRVTRLEQFRERIAMCYCPLRQINERDELLVNIETDITLHHSRIEGNGVVMEHD